MNNVLCISAALKSSSLVLKDGNNIVETVYENDTPTFLVANINDFLENNNKKLENIEGVIACSGPGSFTGIRTTISIVKALKQFLNISAICVNIFDILEFKYMEEISGKSTLLILKSEMPNEVYVKSINSSGNNSVFAISIDSLIINKNIDVIVSNFEDKIFKNCAKIIYDFSVQNANNLLNFIDKLACVDEHNLSSFYVKPPYVKN